MQITALKDVVARNSAAHSVAEAAHHLLGKVAESALPIFLQHPGPNILQGTADIRDSA